MVFLIPLRGFSVGLGSSYASLNSSQCNLNWAKFYLMLYTLKKSWAIYVRWLWLRRKKYFDLRFFIFLKLLFCMKKTNSLFLNKYVKFHKFNWCFMINVFGCFLFFHLWSLFVSVMLYWRLHNFVLRYPFFTESFKKETILFRGLWSYSAGYLDTQQISSCDWG